MEELIRCLFFNKLYAFDPVGYVVDPLMDKVPNVVLLLPGERGSLTTRATERCPEWL